jgi:hypothetical protein
MSIFHYAFAAAIIDAARASRRQRAMPAPTMRDDTFSLRDIFRFHFSLLPPASPLFIAAIFISSLSPFCHISCWRVCALRRRDDAAA